MAKPRSRRRDVQSRGSKADSRQPGNAQPAGAPLFSNRPLLWISLGLIAANVVVYTAVPRYGLIRYDDARYVSDNAMVAAGLTWRGVVWAFTTGYASNWHPLTWVSHMLDVQLYGMQAGGHHVTSLLLHVANTLLLFGVLYRMTGAVGRSGFVAALFAVHPLHVESVAWVAERKDVLSTLFWMLTMWSYVSYVRRPQWHRYVLVVVCFALGLMAKPMLVTLPFVLLLLDFWPLGRMKPDHAGGRNSAGVMPRSRRMTIAWHLLREKLPLLALSVASSIVTFLVQRQGGAVGGLEEFSLARRVENALLSYVGYVWKMFWPARLGLFYPFPTSIPVWQVITAAAILIGVSVVAIRRARRHPYLLVGWLWYLGTLVPVIGLVQVGDQAMADRYTYIPLVGLFVIVAWGVPALVERWPIGRGALDPVQRVALGTTAALIIAALMVTARNQVRHWSGPMAIWEHTQQVTGANAFASNSLGSLLIEMGRTSDAMPHFADAVRIDPKFAGAHNNLGVALIQQGRGSDAIAHFAEAVRLRPQYADAHHNLAMALDQQGQLDYAIREMVEAVRIRPGQALWHYRLARLYQKKGNTELAVLHLERTLTLNPNDQAARGALREMKSRGPQ